jgi:hypothetical protein
MDTERLQCLRVSGWQPSFLIPFVEPGWLKLRLCSTSSDPFFSLREGGARRGTRGLVFRRPRRCMSKIYLLHFQPFHPPFGHLVPLNKGERRHRYVAVHRFDTVQRSLKS